MTEHRFRSPDGNEWVTLTYPSLEILAGYPEGTVEIPMVEQEAPPIDLAAYAADARWRKETGGITVGGHQIDTSRESQGLINGAFNLAQDDPETVIMFKTAGGFVTLDAATVIAIGRAVGKHVQACFAREAEVLAAITASAVATTDEIDAAFADVAAPWSAA